MPRHIPDETALKTRITKHLAGLAKLAPDLSTKVNRRLASWPGRMDRLVDDLVLLRLHEPMEALRGLRELDHRVILLDLCYEEEREAIEPILDRQEQARAFYPDFHLALAQADRGTLIERVFVLLTEPGLLDQDDGFPQALLDALGRDGREAVVRRLIEAGEPAIQGLSASDLGCNWSWSVTELLLADPDVGYALAQIDRLGLRDQVCPVSVVRFLLRHKALGEDFMDWMRKAIGSVGVLEEEEDEDDDSPWRPDREGVALCESEGLTALAQEIRYVSFEILLDTAQLHDWLERLPEARRPREKARAMRHVCADPRRSQALLVLLEWPDLEAATRLVIEHHDEMDGQSCTTFNKAAALFEESAPLAAMLLYRRGAFNQFSKATDWHDSRPKLARCAELWAMYPDSSCDSHEEFLDQLEREKQE